MTAKSVSAGSVRRRGRRRPPDAKRRPASATSGGACRTRSEPCKAKAKSSARRLRLLKDELRDTNAQIVNIIHDEIVVEADADEAEEVAQKVERAMCAAGEEYLKTVPVK